MNTNLIISIVSLGVAIISIIIAFFTTKQLNSHKELLDSNRKSLNDARELTKNSIKKLSSISSLINSAEESGVRMIYEDRYSAFKKNWMEYLRKAEREIIILGTSLQGLLTISMIDSILAKQKDIIKVLIVHPEDAEKVEKQENRQGVIKTHVKDALVRLEDWGIKEVQLLKGKTRNFVVFADDRVLINPSLYGTDSFQYFCIEAEKCSEEIGVKKCVYSQYYDNHFKKVWNNKKLTVKYNKDDLKKLFK